MRLFLALIILATCMTVWFCRSSIYYIYGLHLLNAGNSSESIVFFSKAVVVDPEYKPAYDARGQAYFSMKQFENAERDFTRAIDLDPGYAYAYCHRGALRLELGEEEEGLFDLSKSLDFSSKYAEPYFFLGVHSEKIGNYVDAEKHYLMALSLDPENTEISLRCQDVRTKMRQLERSGGAVDRVSMRITDLPVLV